MNCLVLAVLKKNYTRLCQCLSQDYMKTINKMKELLRIPDDALSKMIELPTADLINEQIIVLIMTGIPSDADALHLCDLMEALVDNEQSIRDIEVVRNGNINCNTHICNKFLL